MKWNKLKPETMKIAIPTNDGLTLSPRINEETSYLVFTLEFGEITYQEKRLIHENVSFLCRCLLSLILTVMVRRRSVGICLFYAVLDQ